MRNLSHLLDMLEVKIPCGFLSLQNLFNSGLQFPICYVS
jgi:hypothetical protein